jgi:hypothetical protein
VRARLRKLYCDDTSLPEFKGERMEVKLEDVLSLLSKYVEERTPVLAVFVTPSLSVARVLGTIRVSLVAGTSPHLIVGKTMVSPTKSNSDCQIN